MLILLFNAEETASRIEFWLQSINTRANGAGVLLVGTHADEAQKSSVKSIIRSMKDKYALVCVCV